VGVIDEKYPSAASDSSPYPQRTFGYASGPDSSSALHLGTFDQPAGKDFLRMRIQRKRPLSAFLLFLLDAHFSQEL
jgi:hypothetical protein